MTAASEFHLFYFFFFVSLCFVSVFGLAFGRRDIPYEYVFAYAHGQSVWRERDARDSRTTV